MDADKTGVKFETSTQPGPGKEEPVRGASAVTVLSAVAVLLLDKFGVTTFSATEVALIVSGVLILANEVARMKVWAKPKQGE